MAAILKIEKRPYFRNALTDLHKIWQDDALWPPEGYGLLKFPTFQNPRWRTAAILKNLKSILHFIAFMVLHTDYYHNIMSRYR